MSGNKRLETTIPFSGFYESVHSEELDREQESVFSDSSGNFIEAFSDVQCDSFDWGPVFLAYAQEYTRSFQHRFKVAIKFKLLQSPREYNFTTDRIFCTISRKEVRRIFKLVDRAKLDSQIAESFTSRSGFMSWYSNSLESWPKDPGEWDHNQIGTLLRVYADQESPDGERFTCWDEHEITNTGNGEAGNALFAGLNKTGERFVKIADYLRAREERKYRHLFARPNDLSSLGDFSGDR